MSGTSNSKDSGPPNKHAKKLNGEAGNLSKQHKFVEESWGDDSIIEGDEDNGRGMRE